MRITSFCNLYSLIAFFSLLLSPQSFAQCSPQMGLPPSSLSFNTGTNGSGSVGSASSPDNNWTVALNSITGPYNPAIIMASTPLGYYNSTSGYAWISNTATGSHSGNQDLFYKRDFSLPCFNLCGKSYDEDNVFCLDLTIYVDNSVNEIYINGVAQGVDAGLIRAPDPYRPPGAAGAVETTVSLCKGWKAGPNSIVIQVASSAITTGLLIGSTFRSPPLLDTLNTSVCEGGIINWRNKTFTKTGIYTDTVHLGPGCDSVKTLNLTVNPKSPTIIRQSICHGQSFLGYSASGTYVDTFVSSTGCDSVRTLQLSVLATNPQPAFESAAYCIGDSLVLSPGDFLSYLWQDGSTEKQYAVTRPGVYAVTVTNACGSSRKEISVTQKACNVLFPSGFTPNQDGKNDLFKILSSYIFQEYSLSVYNRWGQKIFETSDPLKGWDGYYQGKPQQSGTFTWYCRFKRAGNVFFMKGSVLLIQ